jgi:hypothetical protein
LMTQLSRSKPRRAGINLSSLMILIVFWRSHWLLLIGLQPIRDLLLPIAISISVTGRKAIEGIHVLAGQIFIPFARDYEAYVINFGGAQPTALAPTRRLAAILAADVAGYSRLMGLDEEGTLAALKAHRKALIDPKIEKHHRRIVRTTEDASRDPHHHEGHLLRLSRGEDDSLERHASIRTKFAMQRF